MQLPHNKGVTVNPHTHLEIIAFFLADRTRRIIAELS